MHLLNNIFYLPKSGVVKVGQKVSRLFLKNYNGTRNFAIDAATPTGPTAFHGVISKDHAVFKPEPNRYVMFVAYSCPWAHRALMARKLKKLDDFVRLVPVDPVYNEEGLWAFNANIAVDPFMDAKVVRDIYLKVEPNYAGRFTVPLLFDLKSKQIVNNESAEILRNFNTAFNHLIAKPSIDLSPLSLRKQIDSLIDWIKPDLMLAVFKAGVTSKTQEKFDTNCKIVFSALDRVESILAKNRFLAGDIFTEADILLFTAITRFPIAYECMFKLNLKTLRDGSDYPNIHKWAKTVYQIPGIAETVRVDDIKKTYYKVPRFNPSLIMPLYNGPDLSQPLYPVEKSFFAWCK